MTGKLVVEKLLKECKDRNMSIYRLSKTSKIKQSTLNTIIHSKNPNPTSNTIKSIATGFNMSLKEFFDDKIFELID